MRTNLFKDRIQIQSRTVSEGALGQTVVWSPVQWRYGRVIPLSATARAEYQQIGSEAQYKVVLANDITINLADYRFKWGSKTLEPSSPPMDIDNTLVIPCKEL